LWPKVFKGKIARPVIKQSGVLKDTDYSN